MPEQEDKQYVCVLDEKSLKKAKKELNEDPKQRQSQIETFRQWVKSQPHINSRLDDGFLLRFLRASKFSQLRARQVLENFWTMRSVPGKGAPDWFNNMDPTTPEMQEVLDLGIQIPLPGYDDEGRKVLLIRTGHYDPKTISLGNVLKTGFMLNDILLMEERNQVHGMVILLDFTEFSASHVYYWDRATIQKASACWQDTYPTRNKGANYYNTPLLWNALFEVFKLFMSEKTKKRIHYHKADLQSLYKQVPKRMLPEEYGGDAGPIKDLVAANKKLMVDNRDEFLLNMKYGIDESKRIVEKTNGDATAGIVGSFRKLAT